MRRSTFSLLAIGPLLAAAACGSPAAPPAGSSSAAPPPVSSAPPTTTTSAKPVVVAVPTCGPVTIPPLDKGAFPASTKIDGTWMPLPVGAQWTMEGRANRGGGVLPHKIVFTVTDLVEVIDGVPNVVTWDVDTDKGTTSEAELAFFAQDANGNVWNFGEYPEEYNGGKFSAAPSTWLAGQDHAEAGVQVPAKVQIGAPEILQGSSPSVDFLDCAKDVKSEDHVCVPTGCYDKVRVVDERSPLKPDTGVQTKSYAPGVGVVKVGAIADPEGETLVLAERKMLSPAELAKADAEARKLDEHGRATHPIYKAAAPMQGP